MYKQRQYLKWRAETDWSSDLGAAPEVGFTLRAGSRGWWDKSATAAALSTLVASEDVATMSHINTTIQHCIWLVVGFSDTDGEKGDCGQFVMSKTTTELLLMIDIEVHSQGFLAPS